MYKNISLLKKYVSENGKIISSKIDIFKVAEYMSKADIVGFSSMTQYSTTVHKIIAEIRKLNPKAYIIWGGIHAIIEPEDAIKHADAVCTGEGEFAFKSFFDLFINKIAYSF